MQRNTKWIKHELYEEMCFSIDGIELKPKFILNNNQYIFQRGNNYVN